MYCTLNHIRGITHNHGRLLGCAVLRLLHTVALSHTCSLAQAAAFPQPSETKDCRRVILFIHVDHLSLCEVALMLINLFSDTRFHLLRFPVRLWWGLYDGIPFVVQTPVCAPLRRFGGQLFCGVFL